MKRRGVLQSDKRGLSNMIAYIILVGMAVSMSVLAYNWLLGTIPQETITCPEGVSVSIRDVTCTGTDTTPGIEQYHLSFKVKNNGAFTVDKLRIFVNDEERSNVGVFEILPEQITPSFGPSDPLLEYDIDYKPYVLAQESPDPGTIPPFILKSDLKLLEIRPYKTIEGREYACRTVQTKLSCPTS